MWDKRARVHEYKFQRTDDNVGRNENELRIPKNTFYHDINYLYFHIPILNGLSFCKIFYNILPNNS